MSDAELFEIMKRVATTSLATVLIKKGLRNQWIRGPKPLSSNNPRVAGRAFTTRLIPSRGEVKGAQPEPILVNNDAIEAMTPGCIAVTDGRGVTDCATYGDIVITRMAMRGIAGVVTDGAVRDLQGLLASGLPIWALGLASPPPTNGHILVGWQQPIACGGVAVFPDDVIVADSDGAIVIPAAFAEDIAKAGLELEQGDEWRLAEVRRGKKPGEIGPMPKK